MIGDVRRFSLSFEAASVLVIRLLVGQNRWSNPIMLETEIQAWICGTDRTDLSFEFI